VTNQIIAYKKINDCIISCETIEQLDIAKNLVQAYNRLFSLSALSSVLDELLHRKKYLIEMNTRPVVYFLIGPPGVGKSTYINTVLLPSGEYYVASTDNIITKKGVELGLSYDEAFNHFNFKAIEKEFKFGIMEAINERKDLIIDRTNMANKARGKMLRMFPKDYIKIAILFDFSNVELLKSRIAKRFTEEGKSISNSLLYRMIKDYSEPILGEFDQIIKL
jgi:predicted kinase